MTDPNASDWLKSKQRASKKAKLIVTAVAIVVVLAAIGGVFYALVKKPNSKSDDNPKGEDSTLGNVGGAGNGDGNGGDTSDEIFYTNDNRPVDLKITKDPDLKKSFYGINYGPILALYPWCTNTLGDTIEDMKIVSQLTDRVRVYGMDCNMANYTLVAMKKLGLNNMTLIPTIWVNDNITTYKRQEQDLYDLLEEHGADMIAGVSVGNEVLFRKEISPKELYNRIAEVRQKVNGMGFNKKIPVFTSDLGSNVQDVEGFVAANDIIMANVHPYFGGVPVAQAGTWSFEFFRNFDVASAEKENKEAVISEIGWPTRGDPDGKSVASIQNLQTFLDQFVCQANSDNVKYYYFETFDTPWKQKMFTVLEGAWGLFTSDKKLKDGIKFPDCPPSQEGFAGYS